MKSATDEITMAGEGRRFRNRKTITSLVEVEWPRPGLDIPAAVLFRLNTGSPAEVAPDGYRPDTGFTSRRERSGPSELEPEHVSPHLRAARRADDAVRLVLRHLDEGKALQHPHVADRFAVQVGGGGDGVDDV